ncbi:hypothetical protein INT45_011577 [Circinella minor]|uniref:Uncharacterized protein n=1 Tax=Circinella minor TaxID=1195481 RepID=A0A8H7VBF9_9FUNG|nr:hypothetical protein INT45_011577 [Circinella minor]
MSLVQPPPQATQDTFAIAATAISIDVPTPLEQSFAYTHSIPVIVVCLAVCYISVYIMRCIYWQYRRRRKRQLWFERGRLRLFWIQATAREEQKQQEHLEEKLLEANLPTTTNDISSYSLPPRPLTFPNHTHNLSDISLFFPPPPSSSSSSSSSSSYSYILDESCPPPPLSILSSRSSSSLSSSNNTVSATILPRPHSVIGITPMSGYYYDSSTTLAEFSLSTSRPLSQQQQRQQEQEQRRKSNNSHSTTTTTLISTTTNNMGKKWRYWTQNKKKRRKLIWQWSVAMGYCQYTHANRIDYLVHQLQQQRYQENQREKQLIIEKDITDQDEKKAFITSSSSSSSPSYHHNLIM